LVAPLTDEEEEEEEEEVSKILGEPNLFCNKLRPIAESETAGTLVRTRPKIPAMPRGMRT
jgi:hypothetical protein